MHQLKRDLNRNSPSSLPPSLNDKDAINNPEREKLKVNILATEILLWFSHLVKMNWVAKTMTCIWLAFRTRNKNVVAQHRMRIAHR